MTYPLPVADTSPVAHDSSQDFEDFIYLISHDVRNSVRALIELPQWIEEDLAASGVPLGDSVRETIDLMNTHTGRLDRMLFDLLTYSRVGRMQQTEKIDVREALEDVLDEIKLPVGFSVDHDLSCSHVRLGETDVLTVLRALISNAVKHHDKPKGKIKVFSSSDGRFARLSVEDDGPGIPEEFRARVFSAMTTLKPRDEVEGSGMGLAIVRKVAEHYGGEVRLSKAQSGRGARVTLTLPL